MNVKRIAAVALTAFAGFTLMAPTVASAAPRHAKKVCTWHHHHKVCHWVRR